MNVSGAYNYTSSNIVEHSDTFLKVNAGSSEADAGLIVETADTDDARLFYDVSENFWSAGRGPIIFTSTKITQHAVRCDGNQKAQSFKNNSGRTGNSDKCQFGGSRISDSNVRTLQV